jgi:hypothetical protein
MCFDKTPLERFQAFDFRLSEIFSFSREALFGEFRLSALPQVGFRLPVSEWR